MAKHDEFQGNRVKISSHIDFFLVGPCGVGGGNWGPLPAVGIDHGFLSQGAHIM